MVQEKEVRDVIRFTDLLVSVPSVFALATAPPLSVSPAPLVPFCLLLCLYSVIEHT
jgi:hypothetical protein